MSRQLFPGHRIALFISEDAAKRSFTPWLDELIRNPDSNTRVSIYVLKGISSQRFLESEYAMERFSSLYATRTTRIVGFAENIFDLQKEKNNPSRCFMLPVISTQMNGAESQMEFQDIALFDQQSRMIHTLKGDDALLALWMAGKITHLPLTLPVSSDKGTITLDLRKLKHKISVKFSGESVKITVNLTGKGLIRENNTNQYLLSASVKEQIAREMSEQTQKKARQVIQTAQTYRTDIFGIGNQIAWKHPAKWRGLRDNWSQTFSHAEVSVHVKLTINGVGQVGTGPKY
ncbi:germination protein, Ger(x)C family [Paenibacillus sp. BC26]|nr:germination protein, Ger(x)C family [Paenibacillus sp. BC26]